MPLLVGRPAPDFVAPALLAGGLLVDRYHLRTAIKGRYGLLFFNPLAFTFVCSSELSALDRRVDEFRRREVEVLGVTLDAQHQHNVWRNIPVDYPRPADYTLVVDISHRICRDYRLEIPSGSFAHRGVFLIDRRGVVRYQAINDLPLQGEIDDLLRMTDALQTQDAQPYARTSQLPHSALSGPEPGSEGGRLSNSLGEYGHAPV
jgi:peroxiredoxin (alkyl hydroperoxide reductase subunit C)